jgi:hypothetical protein
MHILSSTATFILANPLQHSQNPPSTLSPLTFLLSPPDSDSQPVLSITSISAEAYHNASLIAEIQSDDPFIVPPGENETPRLPVTWKLDGFGTVREALGGRLRVDAWAEVGVRITVAGERGEVRKGEESVESGEGVWEERIWYHGRGIGAHIRL